MPKTLSSYAISREYLIQTYRLPQGIKRGTIVTDAKGRVGVITHFSNYIHVRWEGERLPDRHHVSDLKFKTKE